MDMMLSTRDVGKRIGVAPETIQNYVERGLIVPDDVTVWSKDGRIKRFFFKEDTVAAFVNRYSNGKYHGERLMTTTELGAMLYIGTKTVRNLVHAGKLKPDVVLPSGKDGRSGAMRFTVDTAKRFERIYQRGSRDKSWLM